MSPVEGRDPGAASLQPTAETAAYRARDCSNWCSCAPSRTQSVQRNRRPDRRPAPRQIGAKHGILARDLREPVRGFDRIELAIDIDLLHLIDEDHRRVAVLRNIAGGDLYR